METNFTVRSVYTVIDLLDAPVRLEPVTTEANSQGVIVNPAGVAVGALALYRVEVVPGGLIPDEAIHWTKSNVNVAFYAGRNTGREAVVRGVAPGDFTLEVTIDDLPATYKPYIHGKVLEPTVTPVHVYIICSNNVPAVGTGTVNAWVAEANRIYRQAAMSFYVAGVEHVYDHEEWYTITTNFTQMCSYANWTGGLELYCVNSIVRANGKHSDMNLVYGDARRGMAVKANAPPATLAHEIGHACGLRDIRYVHVDDNVSELRSGTSNWSGGEGTGHHAPGLKHAALVQRLLMFYMGVAQKADIAVGSVMGASVDLPDPYPVGVGLNAMGTRNPVH